MHCVDSTELRENKKQSSSKVGVKPRVSEFQALRATMWANSLFVWLFRSTELLNIISWNFIPFSIEKRNGNTETVIDLAINPLTTSFKDESIQITGKYRWFYDKCHLGLITKGSDLLTSITMSFLMTNITMEKLGPDLDSEKY